MGLPWRGCQPPAWAGSRREIAALPLCDPSAILCRQARETALKADVETARAAAAGAQPGAAGAQVAAVAVRKLLLVGEGAEAKFGDSASETQSESGPKTPSDVGKRGSVKGSVEGSGGDSGGDKGSGSGSGGKGSKSRRRGRR